MSLIEQAVEANPAIPAWRGGLAMNYCWLGRLDEAAAIVAAARADAFAHVPNDQVRNMALALYAEAATTVGDRKAAEILYVALEPTADQFIWTGPTAFGHVRHWLGLLAATLGRYELADDHLGFACGFYESEGVLLWAAHARLRWGEALALRGERERAREQGHIALAIARENRYVAIERRAAALNRAVSPAASGAR